MTHAERQRRYREAHPEYRAREVARVTRWKAKHPAKSYLSNLASHRRNGGTA